MSLSHDLVRSWAQAILAQLGPPAGHTLAVTGPGFPAGPEAGTGTSPDAGLDAGLDAGADRGPKPGTGDRPTAPDAQGPGSSPPFGSSLSLDLSPDLGDHRPDGARGGDTAGPGLLVTVAFADGSSVSVHFEEPMAEAEAVTLLADQLQDAVLEETGGAPRPPCPHAGHGHPAVARIVDGVACWTCPSGTGPARPVLSAS